jgi:hypothetical protein
MGYKNKYKNMGRSNLTFLNADGSRRTHNQILEDIQKQLDAELAKISYSDPQGQAKRDAIFASAEIKIKAENARYETEKAKNMDDLFGNIRNVLSATQTGLGALGINPPTNRNAPIGAQDNLQVNTNKDYTLWYIGGGVLAIGIIGLIIYKSKK